jgi:formate hydrogenlyase subunit 4
VSSISILHVAAGLVLCPLLPGIINRVKALAAGRTGQPVLQLYHDIFKLLRKGAVYSRTTTHVFRAGPVVSLAAILGALSVVPFAGAAGPVSFSGDIVLLAYLLGLARFFTVIAALDTGSAFEGMGASREVTFSALAEPGLLLGLAAIARETGSLSLSGMYGGIGTAWVHAGAAMVLVAAALVLVFLAENSRIPVDDPDTHLELTMIHEVMVLDHGGPDLAMIHYAAALKMWVLGALLVGVAVPVSSGSPRIDTLLAIGAMFALAALVGMVESSMARLRLLRVPQLLVGAGACSIIALALVAR